MEELDALLADLEVTTSHLARRPRPPADPPPTPYGPPPSSPPSVGSERDQGYSAVQKPLAPCPPPSPGLGELDRLLRDLSATHSCIADELLAQVPPSARTEATDEAEDGDPLPRLPPPASTSAATQELDKLMASLSDFNLRGPVGPGGFGVAPAPKPRSGAVPPLPTPQPPLKKGAPPPEGNLDSMLVLLQEDLKRQGVPTEAKVTPPGPPWLSGCSRCGPPGAPTCARCGQPVLHQMVTALDKTWHPEHFCCTHCGQPFGDEGFLEKDGQPYCRRDFAELFSSRCQGCGRPILEGYIAALQGLWHPECFVCRECFAPFVGGTFYEAGGRPYCERHFHARQGSLCRGCGEPIAGRCVTAMAQRFHPEHFVCAFCLRPLAKGTFQEQEGKPYCQPCFHRLFG
ncbi:transforming growth factor beta-1-induced transcript 1 protein isoform X1 [Anser cygnoides]|uniref:transforming growth factor beta-1-induced transcript 1 protein isoform X1 n=1 Tax=Anser cygnoides TaxID=8845 RepID=UPI0034D2AC00